MLLLDDKKWDFKTWKSLLPKEAQNNSKDLIDFTQEVSTFRLADKLFVKYSEKNRRLHRANGFGIEPYFKFYDSEGKAHEVRYYTSVKQASRKGIELNEYEPALLFIEDGEIKTMDAEIAWYMFHYPLQASSPFKHKKKGLFWFKDDKDIAKQKRVKASFTASVYKQIMDDKVGLVEDQLRQLAMIYGIKDAETADLEVIKMELLDKAVTKTKSNPKPEETFLENIESPTMAIMVKIRKAVMEKILIFDESKSTWYFVNQDTRKPDYGMKIKHCLKKSRADDELADYLSYTNEGKNILTVIDSYLDK